MLDTSFRWRHRFLQLPKQKKAAAVSGMVEVDETHFLKSQKGARKVVGRKARKRGGKASRPGLSDEHAAVLIARDRTGATTDAVLDKVDTANVTRHLGGVVQKDTLLISDGEKAYGAFAAALGFLHVWIIASKGEHVWQSGAFSSSSEGLCAPRRSTGIYVASLIVFFRSHALRRSKVRPLLSYSGSRNAMTASSSAVREYPLSRRNA